MHDLEASCSNLYRVVLCGFRGLVLYPGPFLLQSVKDLRPLFTAVYRQRHKQKRLQTKQYGWG